MSDLFLREDNGLKIDLNPITDSVLTFNLNGFDKFIEIKNNGEIWVRGNLIENDKDLLVAIRLFFAKQNTN